MLIYFYDVGHLKDFIGSIATLTTVIQFLTGVLICRTYIRKKSTGEVSGTKCKFSNFMTESCQSLQTSALPFVSGLLSCSLWFGYGFLIQDKSLILVNAIGAFLFALYCATYFVFTVNKRRFYHQIALVLLMITFTIVYSRIEMDKVKASKLIGELFLGNFLIV